MEYIFYSLNSKSWSTKYERENPSEIEENLMKMRNTLWSGRRRLIRKKHFLPFRVLLNVGIDPNFVQKSFFFSLLALFREKFRFPANTFLA